MKWTILRVLFVSIIIRFKQISLTRTCGIKAWVIGKKGEHTYKYTTTTPVRH